jgi:hypothetical protein
VREKMSGPRYSGYLQNSRVSEPIHR